MCVVHVSFKDLPKFLTVHALLFNNSFLPTGDDDVDGFLTLPVLTRLLKLISIERVLQPSHPPVLLLDGAESQPQMLQIPPPRLQLCARALMHFLVIISDYVTN